MKDIALSSDELHPINQYIINWLAQKNYSYKLFGVLKSKQDDSWVDCTIAASQAVIKGECKQAIVCCWSGTGAAIAANKVKNIRAALCTDADTVRLTKVWNDANVLVLANRTLTEVMADEILTEWFNTNIEPQGTTELAKLNKFESII